MREVSDSSAGKKRLLIYIPDYSQRWTAWVYLQWLPESQIAGVVFHGRNKWRHIARLAGFSSL
ncbi:hypothetical protein GCM10009414_05720 [Tatumella terrea]